MLLDDVVWAGLDAGLTAPGAAATTRGLHEEGPCGIDLEQWHMGSSRGPDP